MVDTEGVTTSKLAYIAGFFDGEGTLVIGRYPKGGNRDLAYRGFMAIANTYVPILEEIQNLIGGKIVLQGQHGKMTRPCYSLTFSPNEIRRVLPQLFPYLEVKEKQAEVLLEFLDRQSSNASAPVSRELLQFYEDCYQRMKQFKLTRFEYSRPNPVVIRKRCAQCRKTFEHSSKTPTRRYCSDWCKRKTHWTRSNRRIASGFPAWSQVISPAQEN